MTEILDRPLAAIAAALRDDETSAEELTALAIERHVRVGDRLNAYKEWDSDRALAQARVADAARKCGFPLGPLGGVPVSVKDLYGVRGYPTFAGTARRLPPEWEDEGFLVRTLREQLAVVVGKTHTVELAFGGLGTNPHWGTPVNPWDATTHRVPGGSSCGAPVSLWEGSAVVALGSDTAGSIRVPASMAGTVGQMTTYGRWPATGLVPLSPTLDTVGALTRSVEDAAYFFAAVDRRHGDPKRFLSALAPSDLLGVRIGVAGTPSTSSASVPSLSPADSTGPACRSDCSSSDETAKTNACWPWRWPPRRSWARQSSVSGDRLSDRPSRARGGELDGGGLAARLGA